MRHKKYSWHHDPQPLHVGHDLLNTILLSLTFVYKLWPACTSQDPEPQTKAKTSSRNSQLIQLFNLGQLINTRRPSSKLALFRIQVSAVIKRSVQISSLSPNKPVSSIAWLPTRLHDFQHVGTLTPPCNYIVQPTINIRVTWCIVSLACTLNSCNSIPFNCSTAFYEYSFFGMRIFVYFVSHPFPSIQGVHLPEHPQRES